MASKTPPQKRSSSSNLQNTSSSNQFGLKVIVDPPLPPKSSTPSLNIIFVHGLGGSAYGTWTDTRTNSFWPTWLSKVKGLEHARIMTFGYDSSWNKLWKPNNVLDISDFAKQLVHELWSYYFDNIDSQTVFVTHSMGGLVVKKALIMAYNIECYHQVIQNTIAIIFLGTPHLGIHLNLLKAILNVSFPRTKHVEDLSPESQSIKEINDMFADRSKELKLASFWESTGLGIAGIIVPESSATLGFPGEIRVPLNGNHLTIATYSSEQDNNFQLVSKTIMALIQHTHMQKQPREKQIYPNNPGNSELDNFVVPFERNPLFTGRKEFLRILKERLYDQGPQKYNHRIALYGMGGIGKTQAALEYVYANRDAYDRIYWITAVDQTSLLAGYERVAKKAGLKTTPELKPIEMAERVLLWLRQEKCWLVVIDNLDDISVVAQLLPQNGPHQHTLITTRDPNPAGVPAEGMEVPLLDVAESIELLYTLSMIANVINSAESIHATQIVQELGYLPLGIEQAAAYIREVAGDFATFLSDYKKNHKAVHKWVSRGNRTYPHSVATTWFMSFNVVRKHDPQAAELFQLLSFLNPDGVLIDFLHSGMNAFPEGLKQIVASRIRLSKALIELEKCSLIKWNRQKNTLVVHRLVQTVMRDQMSEEERKTLWTTVVEICDKAFPKEWSSDTRLLCRIYFGQVLTTLMSDKEERSLELADIMARVGDFLERDGKFNDSAKLLEEVVQIRAAEYGTDDLSTLMSMNSLALTYRQQGRMNEAAKLNEELLEKRARILGDDHPVTLTSMNNLAETYRHQGRMKETTRLHEEALEKRKQILGDNHPDTLTSMNNLAWTYSLQGRLDEAAKLEEEVLEKRKMILGDDDPVTLMSMNNLASIYFQQGQLDEAAKLEEEVLQKQNRILGDDHPDTLTSMSNLASMYQTQGRLNEAAKFGEKVLEKRKRILGDEHPSTLMSKNNLASTYWRQGRSDEAAKLREEVLEKRKNILGDDHPDTLMSMNNLAMTYWQQGKTNEATKLHEEVSEKMKKILGNDHPDTLTSMNNLAFIYGQQARINEAARLEEEVLEKRKKILGDEHPDTLTSMNNLAETYGQQGRMNEATKLHEEALDKMKKILGDDHPNTLTSMNNLTLTYRRINDAAKLPNP